MTTTSRAASVVVEPTPSETRRARLMFITALLWLGCVALVLHFHERPQDAPIFWAAAAGVALLTPVFWCEGVWRLSRSSNRRVAIALQALLPILRVGGRDDATGRHVWLPLFGWCQVTPQLVQRLSQGLSGPMIAIAILVLPVLLVEMLLTAQLERNLTLWRVTQFATSLIWWSFTVEFVLMVSITEKRLVYCKEHVLDLIVILLPFLFFLRALRLGQLLRLQNLSKTARVYKLRGVAMRTYRALLLFEVVRRVLQGGPEKRLARLQSQMQEIEARLAEMREEARSLELQICQQKSTKLSSGSAGFSVAEKCA